MERIRKLLFILVALLALGDCKPKAALILQQEELEGSGESSKEGFLPEKSKETGPIQQDSSESEESSSGDANSGSLDHTRQKETLAPEKGDQNLIQEFSGESGEEEPETESHEDIESGEESGEGEVLDRKGDYLTDLVGKWFDEDKVERDPTLDTKTKDSNQKRYFFWW